VNADLVGRARAYWRSPAFALPWRCMITRRTLVNSSVGVMLVGIGIVFAAGVGFWPWILAVVGAATLPAAAGRDRVGEGLQTFIWLVSLTILFALDAVWPGVLVVVALSAVAHFFVPIAR